MGDKNSEKSPKHTLIVLTATSFMKIIRIQKILSIFEKKEYLLAKIQMLDLFHLFRFYQWCVCGIFTNLTIYGAWYICILAYVYIFVYCTTSSGFTFLTIPRCKHCRTFHQTTTNSFPEASRTWDEIHSSFSCFLYSQ
jgi:hypothetical protein